ncbi:SrtB family sortase [Sporosarcina sp. PTS2304]|uniref:class B sortase n=1 Tax=Sporosarcina sp. PTS2304 TaxID=2283194 RepID=UPI000E0CD92D|nr:class B sortase [Sporosarcina sp. PTS2304]AXI00631.1 SrtB family sortase [Sporosarcina sp. PTS2304]
MKKRLSNYMPLLYLGIFLYSGYLLVQYLYTYVEAASSLQETQMIYEKALEETSETVVESKAEKKPSYDTIRPQFHKLHAVNEQIVGWISVEGTKVNNPILQSEDNDFYLNRNFNKEKSRAGSVFMDFRNDITDMNQNTVIYGHAMKNDTMFGSLKKFGQQEYADEHSTIYVDTLYEGYDIEVFAAYETTIDFYYIETDFQTKEEYAHYLQEVQSRSLINTPVTVGTEDRIVTLSTCNNSVNSKDKRYVVQGKLVKR